MFKTGWLKHRFISHISGGRNIKVPADLVPSESLFLACRHHLPAASSHGRETDCTLVTPSEPSYLPKVVPSNRREQGFITEIFSLSETEVQGWLW